MILIREAKKWHRLWSMRFLLATTFFSSISAAYLILPADWLPAIPQWIKGTMAMLTLLCAGATGVSRVIQQSDVLQEKVK